MPFIPNTSEDIKEMLKKIGVSSFEELLRDIPEDIRLKKPLNLPPPLSEEEIKEHMKRLAFKNKTTRELVSFLGAGSYDHIIPSVVSFVISRPEFYTAYTPYQAEVSQGTLQAIYEYQSLICELFDMDVSNASMYDAASALGESVHMARDITKRKKILVSLGVHPWYQRTILTYSHGLGVPVENIKENNGVTDLEDLKDKIDENTAGVIIQHPNFFGNLEPVFEVERIVHEKGALLIVDVDPISLGILEPPGKYNADIAIAEGQPLGIPQSFGGPYLGILTTKRQYIRLIPGRLIGKTTDSSGKTGFVMTLQTREQHIRREKATSNICTNEALMALAATVFLSFFGKEGIKEIANQCVQKSHFLAEKIDKLRGYSLAFPVPFFKEFTIRCTTSVKKIIKKGIEKGFLAGVDLGRFNPDWKDLLLIAVTERRKKEEMENFVEFLISVS